jgi:hypothetical protein
MLLWLHFFHVFSRENATTVIVQQSPHDHETRLFPCGAVQRTRTYAVVVRPPESAWRRSTSPAGPSSSTSRENIVSLFDSSAAGVSNSATCPPSMQMILSLSMIVLRRCAMVRIVQPGNAVRIVRWIAESVSKSTLDVASSSSRMRVCRSSTRARQSSCAHTTTQPQSRRS